MTIIDANSELNHDTLKEIILRDYPNVKYISHMSIGRTNHLEDLYSVISKVMYKDGSFGKLDNIFTKDHERRY